MQIFLSYASEDKVLAEQVALALGGGGYDVFFDRSSLPAGGDFHSRILAAIGQADLFVFLASADAVRAGAYTLTELKFARERWPHPQGCVLPVRLPGVAIGALPPYLTSVTVLEPEGNVAAEVLSAVRAMRPPAAKGPAARNKLIAAAAGVLVVAGAMFWLMSDRDSPPQTQSSVAESTSQALPDTTPTTTKPVSQPSPGRAQNTKPASPSPRERTPEPRASSVSTPSSSSDEPLSRPQAEALMRRLEAVNIKTDEGNRSQVVGWLMLDDRRYERIASASEHALAGRRLRAPTTIEVIVYKYAKLSGHDDEQGLPINPTIDPDRVTRALVESFNEQNGGSARSLDEIARR